MADITIHADIVTNIAEWIEDQVANDYDTKEIRANFLSGELELYDYETGVVESRRPLSYFKLT